MRTLFSRAWKSLATICQSHSLLSRAPMRSSLVRVNLLDAFPDFLITLIAIYVTRFLGLLSARLRELLELSKFLRLYTTVLCCATFQHLAILLHIRALLFSSSYFSSARAYNNPSANSFRKWQKPQRTHCAESKHVYYV